MAQSSEFRVEDLKLWGCGLGFGVQGSGLRKVVEPAEHPRTKVLG